MSDEAEKEAIRQRLHEVESLINNAQAEIDWRRRGIEKAEVEADRLRGLLR